MTSHGTAAAQVTYLVKGILKNTFSRENLNIPISDVMMRIAHEFRSYDLAYAIGLALGRLDLRSGSCDYISSNFPDPHINNKETASLINPESNPIIAGKNLAGDDRYVGCQFLIQPGERLYIFSDGCFEFEQSNSKTVYGYRRFGRVLSDLAQLGWRDELQKILSSANGNRGFDDDLTIMCIHHDPIL